MTDEPPAQRVAHHGHDPRAAAVGHLLGVALLREAAGVLARAGIALMPLKGIWLQQLAYAAPEQRPITDVDVLVRERDFEPALSALARAGFALRSRDVAEAALLLPGCPLPLDLHRALFTRHAFALGTEAVFGRGVRDRAQFGVELILPDALDVFAHLVGHFLKSRATAQDAVHVRDFEVLGARFALDPGACARHLQAHGLGRAARYVLPLASAGPQHARDGFCARVLRALPRDRLGAALAGSLLRLVPHLPRASALRALPGYALDRSLGAGVTALGARLQDKARRPAEHG